MAAVVGTKAEVGVWEGGQGMVWHGSGVGKLVCGKWGPRTRTVRREKKSRFVGSYGTNWSPATTGARQQNRCRQRSAARVGRVEGVEKR